ncbi:ParA family protein [Desulfuromonas acetoxidans]|uniref:Cobyrinic acid a,c-diamide synthase n=1 Tax=Desulfuromonas acetoxidans (strain DSM 684 / 11070) TaxID=281689 RepID=Q1K4E5_DESA6|nr:AAA family ATPase [Desulfuromonas acetoxidans]EAT17158.1 Cobyrinic acid a,c-diamide synthase [Desulfuromonas acetoxidans DSM 684]MBF0646330.1 AAA family ATPase [Desulfuromonas acetoxidans]NVD24255.1 AAA family ATPase [Desulfuromonas acetoxidans]NVE14972.1 AAA family ATPase [Desulfuromonas acetoxidans]
MKTVACYSIKGGVGKTASAVNFSYWSAHQGHRTLLIDLDAQGASSFYFRVRNPSKKNWAKRFFKTYEQLLDQIKQSDFNQLDILPAHHSFRHFDTLLAEHGGKTNRLRKVLKGLAVHYDVVIFDCPPSISLLAENIFAAADLISVPMIPTTLSQRTFGQLLDFFDQQGYSQDRIRPFFTLADGRKQLHRDTAATLRKAYPLFLEQAIPHSTYVEKMGLHQAPIDLFAHNSQANRCYQALWQEIASALNLNHPSS